MTIPPSRGGDAGPAQRFAGAPGGRGAANPQALEAELEAGRRSEERNRPGEALAHYRAGLAMALGNPAVLCRIGSLLSRAGQHAAAIEHLTEACRNARK